MITDTVTVNSTNQAFGASSATATDVVASATQADLALTTSATPLLLSPGNDITYTQTVTNNGPASATGRQLYRADSYQYHLRFRLRSRRLDLYSPLAHSVTCTDPSMASGTSAAIIVVVNVAASVTATTITANSSVTATTTDPNSANNSTLLLPTSACFATSP